MKKKLFMVALMAALSSMGYAAGVTMGDVNQAYADAVTVGKEDHNKQQTEIDSIKGVIEKLPGEINQAYADAVTVGKEDHNKQQIEIDSIEGEVGKLQNAINGNTQQIVDLNNQKLDKAEYEKDKLTQEKRDEEQDGKIHNVSQRLENFKDQVNSDNAAQNDNIRDNAAAIEANKNAITETNKQVETNKNAIASNSNRLDKLENGYNQVNGRVSGLEKRVDKLDDKMNKGLSLMAAMNAVDFQNVEAGEMAIGAGIGHYGNAQSVALGVSYSPVEDLNLNAKYSVTAGEPESFAVGAGASYKFKIEG